jgi:cell division protein FtsZ
MIEIARTGFQNPQGRVKVVGVGGAGSHVVDAIAREGYWAADLVVSNTDARALASSFTACRVGLGQRLTRGLGAGGDPELGRRAVEESRESVAEIVMGSSLVVLIAGLGGGTGSGGAARIAEIAISQGAHVVALVTMPFSFEGQRRAEQAAEGLRDLQAHSDIVVCFENERMRHLADSAAAVEETFGAADRVLSEAVRCMVSMVQNRSILHSGLDEIASVVSGGQSGVRFGYGQAHGDNRSLEALDHALRSPLMGGASALSEVDAVWVYVSGGSDLRWSEVESVMREVHQYAPTGARLFMGTGVEPDPSGALKVTILAGTPTAGGSATHARVASVHAIVEPESVAVWVDDTAGIPSEFEEPPAVLGEQEQEHEGDGDSRLDPPSMEVGWGGEAVLEPQSTPADSNALAAELLPPVFSELPLEDGAQPEPSSVSASESAPVGRTGDRASGVRPPFEQNAESRRDIGAAFLKRRLLARNAEVTARAEQEKTAREALRQGRSNAEEAASDMAEERGLGEDVEPLRSVPGTSEVVSSAPSLGSATPSKGRGSVQEQMHFEPVNRGRFEKTDPTMVDGQDLDVPTFMRQRVNLGGNPLGTGGGR